MLTHRSPRDTVVEAGCFSLPVLATVALYLPSGLLMPVRLVTLVLVLLAAWQVAGTRLLPAPRVLIGVAAASASFTIFGAIAMLRYPDRTSVVDATHVGFIILTCLALAVLTTTRRVALASVWGWAFSGLLAGTVGFWEIATGNHLPGNIPAQAHAGVIPGWNEISSFFDNPNLYAYQLVATVLLLPVLFRSVGDHWARWLTLPFGVALGVLLLWTQARMALITLAVGATLWCLWLRWTRIVALIGTVITTVTMALALPPGRYLSDFVTQAFTTVHGPGESAWVRAEMALSGWWMLQQSNYLGVGPGGYARWALDEANPHTYQQLNNAHWGMVEVGAEYGIVTLIVLVAALMVGAVLAVRTARRLRPARAAGALDRVLLIGGAVAALTLPVLCISHSTWLRQPLTAVHLGLIVSLLAVAELATPLTGRSVSGPPGPALQQRHT